MTVKHMLAKSVSSKSTSFRPVFATKVALAALLAGSTFLASVSAEARTFRWAVESDALTLDPHAQNEGPTITFGHSVYEPLVERLDTGALVPLLATEWGPLADDPTIWEFKIREGVSFHNGSILTAEDVAFSLERAASATSDMKGLLASMVSATAIDDYTVHVQTTGPNPLFANNLNNIFIMEKAWAEANDVLAPQDFAAGEESYAVRNTNGTGPFILVSREADVRTTLRRNDNYWGAGEVPLEITELVYTPIQAAATRVAALLSGEVDFVQSVPVQDIQRLEATANLRVNIGPENRTIFLGMDLASEDLDTDDVDGANPFADLRVRQAMNMAINREAIQQVVMRGQSVPAGVIAPPFVNGWTAELDAYPAQDLEQARALLAEAGYGDGFTTTMHCPNDRYVNDEAICQAVIGMLGQIGMRVNLVSQSRSLHFPLITRDPPETDFYLVGWGVPTFDSEYIFSFLYHSREGSYGSWNPTGYANPEVDAMIKSLSEEVNVETRNATIAKIWQQVTDDQVYIAIHNQALAYAMNANVDIAVDPNNQPKMKYVSFLD